jgi:hypothetical protein
MLKQSGLKLADISLFEVNEAFSVVALVTAKQLDLDLNKINMNGGAVALVTDTFQDLFYRNHFRGILSACRALDWSLIWCTL